MAELRQPPGPLERALGQLVEAGLSRPEELAAFLGLEPQQVARPLRRLSQAGVLHRHSDDGLMLTREGRAWLAVEFVMPGGDVAAIGTAPAAPRLSPFRLEPWEDLLSPARQDLATSSRLVSGWRRVRPRLPRPSVRVPAGSLHRLAALAAVATILMAGFESGLLQWGLATTGLSGRPTQAQAAEDSSLATLTPSLGSSTLGSDGQWMMVQNTEGLGLALRPEPASTVPLRTLPEGTRVRLTGAAVEAGGRAWLPVEAFGDQIGWVAAEFLAATS